MELWKTFPDEDYGDALESWSWLAGERLEPKFTSLFGAIFFAAPDNAIWLLNPIDGELTREWATRADLDADLATEEGRDWYLMTTFAMAAHRHGLVLGPKEVYHFAPPPVLSGDFAIDNIQVCNFTVALTIAGQLHQQLRNGPAE